MASSVLIPGRFNGPPDSANGGYACGVVASLLPDGAQVTLRSPPPLDRALRVVRHDEGVEVLDGETLVAQGVPGTVEITPPPPLSYAEAEHASHSYIGFHHHPFPTCFVCGPRRPGHDGLGLFPGVVPSREHQAAAPWVPDPSVCDGEGLVHRECVWASLDCPSYFGIATFGPEEPGVLLGRLAARIDHRPRQGERCVVIGWGIDRQGRKLHAGSALYSEERGLLAVGRATWILLRG